MGVSQTSSRLRSRGVALVPQCAECGEFLLPTDEDRWEAYLTDDEPPELAFYCPACAEREFGRLAPPAGPA